MKHNEIKTRLISCVDKNSNVLRPDRVKELLMQLKSVQITKDQLEESRLGKIVNDIRKATSDSVIAEMSKSLIKLWKNKFLSTPEPPNPTKTKPAPSVPYSNGVEHNQNKILPKSGNLPPENSSINNNHSGKRKRVQTTAELVSTIDLTSLKSIEYMKSLESEVRECLIPPPVEKRQRKEQNVIKNCPKKTNQPNKESKGPILVKIKLSDINKFTETKPETKPETKIEETKTEPKEKFPGLSPRTAFRRSIVDKLPKYDKNNLPVLKWMTPKSNVDNGAKNWTECCRITSLDNDDCVIFPYCDVPKACGVPI